MIVEGLKVQEGVREMFICGWGWDAVMGKHYEFSNFSRFFFSCERYPSSSLVIATKLPTYDHVIYK